MVNNLIKSLLGTIYKKKLWVFGISCILAPPKYFLARTYSSRRGRVSFCSIECVLATKICGEAKIHEISRTQKSFQEIPPRSDSISLLANFLMFPKSKLRKYLKLVNNLIKSLLGGISRNDLWVLDISCILASPQSFVARTHPMLQKLTSRDSTLSVINWVRPINNSIF